jgi:hypothetical protein
MSTHPIRSLRLLAAVAVLATVASLGGCKVGEEGTDFTVVNQTSETLHFVGQVEGSSSSSSDTTFQLGPREQTGLRTGLSRGSCIYTTFTAYDAENNVVATKPAPICEDKHGHGGTWTITGK